MTTTGSNALRSLNLRWKLVAISFMDSRLDVILSANAQLETYHKQRNQ